MARLLTFLGALALAAPAAAQMDEEDPTATAAADDGVDDGLDDGAGGGGAAADVPPMDSTDPSSSGRIEDEQALLEDEAGVETRSAASPYEEEHKAYYFLGAFYRHNWTPNFLQSLFLDESTAASNPAVGLEFTYRKDSFEIITSIWYQSYYTNGPYRGKDDTLGETEFIDSELQAAFVGAAFLWSTMFTDWIGLEYGLDIGIGGVWGDLHRNEAYPSTAAGSVDGWTACQGELRPVSESTYCERGGNYGTEASWIDGGSRPVIWARLAPHLAIRIKPIHQLVLRIDGGFDIFSGFFFGGAAAFGF